jgi:hypothetical protein
MTAGRSRQHDRPPGPPYGVRFPARSRRRPLFGGGRTRYSPAGWLGSAEVSAKARDPRGPVRAQSTGPTVSG